MPKKRQLSDAIGPFERKSNLDHLHDSYAAASRLNDEARGFWEPGSSESDRWERACHDLEEYLNQVLSRKKGGDKLEDVLADFIHVFCHSEYRIVELLSSPEREADIPPSLEWLHVLFRAGIYGTIRTWLPRAQEEPAAIRLTINTTNGTVTEEYSEHTPWQILRKYRRFK